MTWQEGVAVAVVLAGLAAGAFIVAQRPTFWVEFGSRVLQRIGPMLVAFILKRKSPEAEARDHATERQGGNTAPRAHGHGGENR